MRRTCCSYSKKTWKSKTKQNFSTNFCSIILFYHGLICGCIWSQLSLERILYEGHSEIIDTPFPERKRKIYSSTWNSIIPRPSLWGFNPSLDRFNQHRKKGKKSTFDRNLNVALSSSSTSLRVKTAIPCVLSLNFENRGEYQVDRWLSFSRRRNSRRTLMYRKKLSKASQEWLWTDADQNDSFSDSSFLLPIQPILQN